jgi:putative glutamine amidotransferase
MAPRIGLTTSPSVLEDRAVAALERSYIDAVAAAGGVPFVLPVLDPSQAVAVVSNLDGLLLTGGGDVDPAWYGAAPSPHLGIVDRGYDAWELALLRASMAAGQPVLGVCRGLQLMNVALGGTLVQHLPEITDVGHCVKEASESHVHRVRVAGGSVLGSVVGTDLLGVNSLHHQAVSQLADGLVAVAWAEDGIVEAAEGIGTRLLGVQWHPELLAAEPEHAALFAWLCLEASTFTVTAAA